MNKNPANSNTTSTTQIKNSAGNSTGNSTGNSKKIATLLMAAGQSRRMGQNKLLLPVEGQSLLRRTAQTLLQSGFDDLFVITGHESARAHASLESLHVTWTHNSKFESGLLSSLQAGIEACPESFDAVMVVLADQIHLNPKHLHELVDFFQEDRSALTAPLYGEQRGHPVIIPRRFFKEILEHRDSPEKGAQFLFKNHPESIRTLAFPDGPESADLDTPEDYARLVQAESDLLNPSPTLETSLQVQDEMAQLKKEINSQNQREVYS